ncbi:MULTISPECIES: hypothetical protein [Curtobacterium]|uniref:hypothetical protein n=1 Tax=Curtobacterium TaxID=2034 RepID=UPI00188C4B2A|nr:MULTISPECIES: hypothetical protein [Curtobacterium]MBF4605655.1 hypothetical protein [Curtobacterium sp. VKM Ac-2884]MBT1624154.1 hypothetical protein [Curtobacterium flaccumfaciens pv. oortii]
MPDQTTLEQLRQSPVEWRRRGLTPPADLHEIVQARLSAHMGHADPSYADFFVS